MERYDPKIVEKKWQAHWEKEKTYQFDMTSDDDVYSIDTPPPTVSGRMHIGHAFSFSQQDFIARYKRMRGFNVFYPFGTDDNGLATEKLVQKKKNIVASRMDRNEFIKACLDFLKEERPLFIQDWKNVGMSCDFNMTYSSIDENCRRISQRTFLEMAKKKLVYRKEAPVIWDTVFQTAIAQAELEDKEFKSFFNDIAFKDESGKEIIIATTRPELLGACVAVFKHPDDERHEELGGFAITPLYNAKVPVINDDKVDMEKGTGLVMCCTFGDQKDIEWYKQYNLQLRMVITPDGKMNDASGRYTGMKLADARKEVIQDLKDAGLLKGQKEITHVVQVGERSGEPVEIINSKQWYIQYLDKKEMFLEASEQLKWYPQHMKHRLDNWIKGLNWDWSVSRQRHFGVPIPVWYDEKGNIYFADESQLPVDPVKDRPKGVSDDIKLIPEKDVFDTWFTSGSTPFLATELVPEKMRSKLFPMDLRPQAHDIINFWLFYTVAKTKLLYDKLPWSTVLISGWALDPHGRKMSKSKGNVIAPQDMIEKYSADALRFWAAGSKLGDDMPFQEKDLVTGNKMTTKLWNASSFVMMHLQDFEYEKHELELMDKWLLTKLQKTIKNCTEYMEKYEYSKAKLELEMFFWQVFCDNYLEFVKDRLYNPGNYHDGAKPSAQFTLYEALLNILKLLAPVMPFITEELYHQYFSKTEKTGSVHKSSWPVFNETLIDEDAEKAGDYAVIIASEARKYKSSKQLSLKAELGTIVVICSATQRKLIEGLVKDLLVLANAKDLEFEDGDTLSIKFA